ncbi:MAG: response regulator transcription factor [Colwellia sp.]
MELNLELMENTQSLEANKELQKKLLLIDSGHYLSQIFTVKEEKRQYQTEKLQTERGFKWELKKKLVENYPSMILLNVGFSDSAQLIIRDIRALFDGLLVVVSSKICEQEQINAFTLGVDDYLLRPTNSRILMMRIEGLFRRQKNKTKQANLSSLTIGEVCLKLKAQKCFINGALVKLTTFEFNLLRSLIEHQGNILSRDELYRTLLRRTYNGVERTLDVRMSQLREKLTIAGMKDYQIETVWGQGYMFNHISASL